MQAVQAPHTTTTDYFQAQLGAVVQVAVPLSYLEEVHTFQGSEVSSVPGVTSHCLGAVNLRGQLLWLVDLASLLALRPPLVLERHNRLTVIHLSHRGLRLSCLVDRLQGIVSLSQVDAPPAHLKPAVRALLQGLAVTDTGKVAVLDVPAVFESLRRSMVLL